MRPKLYNTPEEMLEVIEAYFSECLDNVREIYTKEGGVVQISAPIPLSIEGLCDTLQMTRQSLLNYTKQDEFFDIIKNTKRRILRNQIESGLMGITDKTMTIFLLKNNHNYSDKQEIEQTTTHKNMPIEFVSASKPES